MLAYLRSWWERRKLKKLIRTMTLQLLRRYGAQEFYTPDQVVKTCEGAKLDQVATEQAVAMYVEPKVSEGILARLNRSSSANEIRKYLIARCFDGFSEGDGAPQHNAFMHYSSYDDLISGGSDNLGDGHSGGDFGSGHH
jgi:hypothetical protein